MEFINLHYVNEKLQHVVDWCSNNKLTINTKKTEYVIFRGKNRLVQCQGIISIKGEQIYEVQSTQYIGVDLDNKLTWKEHTNKVNKTISSKAGILYKIKHIVPQPTLLLLYNCFILPHISYSLEVWGNTYATYLKPIYLTQKRIVRTLTNSNRFEHTQPLFHELEILDVFKQYTYQTVLFVYDNISGNFPSDIPCYFSSIQHLYPTRSKDKGNLLIPKYTTNIGQCSMKYSGVTLWNQIPESIRSLRSKSKVKRDLKRHLLFI